MIASWLMVGACVVILGGAAFLWASQKYDEGVLGHLGLVCLIVSCLVMLEEILVAGVRYEVLPESLVLRVGVALFLLHLCIRHLCYLRWGRREQPATSLWARVCRHF